MITYTPLVASNLPIKTLVARQRPTNTHTHTHAHTHTHTLKQVDPLVSLMMVEKVPDSTYDMVGGLDKQIKEIKEVGVTNPALFHVMSKFM